MDHRLGRRDHPEGAGGDVLTEDRHLAHSSKWHQIVIEARKNDMDQSRSSTISEWSAAEDTLGPIPDLNNEKILKDLEQPSCVTGPCHWAVCEPSS